MENSVLGNALEGVPEESSEEGEKQNDSKIESADNLDGGYFGGNTRSLNVASVIKVMFLGFCSNLK